jgi:hypothetical protein
VYTLQSCIIKPTKVCIKWGEEEEGNENKMDEQNCSNDTLHIYGITTMKTLYTINIQLKCNKKEYFLFHI